MRWRAYALCLALALLVYAGWILGHTRGYHLTYEDMVRNTVCDMVKPEQLRRPCG